VIRILRPRHVFKVVFIGDPSVGKTSIVAKHISRSFKENYIPTLGVNISSKDYDMAGHSVTLMIWDIAGQEIFKQVREKYYSGAKAAFIVYDVTKPETLENIPAWFEDLHKFIQEKIEVVLVENKIDLPRKVDWTIGQKVANAMKADFIGTSARTGENIEKAFERMVQLLIADSVPTPKKGKKK